MKSAEAMFSKKSTGNDILSRIFATNPKDMK
jgi:hypothetical protein